MSKKTVSTLRIIGGTFRSRKIFFTESGGLRPTHNRVRETVFNWLAPYVESSVCLDAFAGSGAMGFEALSRGAKHVTFCDISKTVIDTLQENAAILKINNADFLLCDFLQENKMQKKFDIVFLDPPFQKNILLQACELLESRDLLAPCALIYLEFQKNSVELSQLPKNWIIKKHQSTQTIEYALCQNHKAIFDARKR